MGDNSMEFEAFPSSHLSTVSVPAVLSRTPPSSFTPVKITGMRPSPSLAPEEGSLSSSPSFLSDSVLDREYCPSMGSLAESAPSFNQASSRPSFMFDAVTPTGFATSECKQNRDNTEPSWTSDQGYGHHGDRGDQMFQSASFHREVVSMPGGNGPAFAF